MWNLRREGLLPVDGREMAEGKIQAGWGVKHAQVLFYRREKDKELCIQNHSAIAWYPIIIYNFVHYLQIKINLNYKGNVTVIYESNDLEFCYKNIIYSNN